MARAGREDEVVVVDRRALGEDEPTCGDVHGHDVGEQDASVFSLRPDDPADRIGRRPAGESAAVAT
jgi:hypothetical protein